LETVIPAASIKEMIDAGLKSLVIGSPLGVISYNLTALQSMYGQGAGESFSFLIHKVAPAELNEAMQAVAAGNDVYEIKVMRGGRVVANFGTGQVTTRLNYKLQSGQSAYGVKVWLLDEDGKLTGVTSAYNSAQGYVEFTRSSHSFYMIGYDVEAAKWTKNPFADVKEGDWFYDAVRFVYERGIMTGTGTEPMLFSPNVSLTRGMLVSILYRLAGESLTADGRPYDNPFTDITEGVWYTDAVKWAAANGVVAGYGDGRFGPNDNITREQLAVILFNYQQLSEIIPPADNSDLAFADSEKISDWAKVAVNRLTEQGLISGKPGNADSGNSANIFDPKSGATRAETASILERFITRAAE
jgi:hypothetical protein